METPNGGSRNARTGNHWRIANHMFVLFYTTALLICTFMKLLNALLYVNNYVNDW